MLPFIDPSDCTAKHVPESLPTTSADFGPASILKQLLSVSRSVPEAPSCRLSRVDHLGMGASERWAQRIDVQPQAGPGQRGPARSPQYTG